MRGWIEGQHISADSAASAGELMEGIPGVGEVKKEYFTYLRKNMISGERG